MNRDEHLIDLQKFDRKITKQMAQNLYDAGFRSPREIIEAIENAKKAFEPYEDV